MTYTQDAVLYKNKCLTVYSKDNYKCKIMLAIYQHEAAKINIVPRGRNWPLHRLCVRACMCACEFMCACWNIFGILKCIV